MADALMNVSPMMVQKLNYKKIIIRGWTVWTLKLMNQPIKIQLVESTNKKSYKTLGTREKSSPMSPASLNSKDYYSVDGQTFAKYLKLY